jgi:dTDP-4-dehydrorhamnose 3,5-epimerase
MKIIETGFKDLYLLEPRVFEDSRGYFMESFNANVLDELGLDFAFVQDSQSYSREGVVRGLHYQNTPHAQTKLIRVLSGTILDVVVDLRKDEPTFGKHYSVKLSAEGKQQLYVPKGFAHGFSVLSASAEILYKSDCTYHPESEGGLLYNDPTLKIDWGLPENKILVSAKDKMNPVLKDANFKF